MIKWEYTVSKIDFELNAQTLNRSGIMGWELVQVFSPNPRIDQAVCIWKRVIEEQETKTFDVIVRNEDPILESYLIGWLLSKGISREQIPSEDWCILPREMVQGYINRVLTNSESAEEAARHELAAKPT